jgi:hypothetical protein
LSWFGFGFGMASAFVGIPLTKSNPEIATESESLASQSEELSLSADDADASTGGKKGVPVASFTLEDDRGKKRQRR